MSEQILYEKLIEDFEIGFQELFFKFYNYLLNQAKFSFRINHEDSEEITADVLLKCYREFKNFEFHGEGSIRQWLFKILKNTIIDYKRREKKFSLENKILFYDENPDSEDVIPLDGTAEVLRRFSLEENIATDERKNILYEILNKFSEMENADIFSYFNCVPYRIIAEETNSTEEAIKKRITRTLQKFSKEISKLLQINSTKIYESFKEIHKEDVAGRASGK